MGRQNTKRESIQSVHEVAEALERLKKNILNRLITLGKKYHALRYPVLIGIVIFILLYNIGCRAIK